MAALALVGLFSACGQPDQPNILPSTEMIDSAGGEDDLEPACSSLADLEARAACERIVTHRRPTEAVVDDIERRLAGHPCVGNLARWQRLYSFDRTINDQDGRREISVNEARIPFKFRQAGQYGWQPERRITAPKAWVNIDDRVYDMVYGYFDVASRRLTIEFCGPNVRGVPQV